MRWGLITRADCTGLAHQTWEIARHLRPDRVLIADLRAYPRNAKLPWHPEWYAEWDAPVVEDVRIGVWEGLGGWLDGLDAIFTAETPYDYRLYDICRTKGVATICQANPEFYRYPREINLPRPDVIVTPTTWMTDKLPHIDGVLPVGIDRARCKYRQRTEATTFLHVIGRAAHRDRQGTRILLTALRRIQSPVHIVIVSQEPARGLNGLRRAPRHVQVEVRGPVDNYWEMYEGADVLIAPRRYGGLSLVLQEALSCGLVPLTLDREPESSFYGLDEACRLRSVKLRPFMGQPGLIDIWEANPGTLAQGIDRLATHPETVAGLSQRSDRIAAGYDWSVVSPVYEQWLRKTVEVAKFIS